MLSSLSLLQVSVHGRTDGISPGNIIRDVRRTRDNYSEPVERMKSNAMTMNIHSLRHMRCGGRLVSHCYLAALLITSFLTMSVKVGNFHRP